MDVWTIVSVVLGALALFFGAYVLIVKTKLGEAVALLKDVADYGQLLLDATADNKVDDVEKVALKAKWAQVVADAKALVAKKAA
jgi:hypothetical protein